MIKIPKISEAEWRIMKVMWRETRCTANEVVSKLENEVDWKPKTIKTMLNRLVKKNAISFEVHNRTYHYYPIVSEVECIKAENKSFINRIYDGSLNAMTISFLKQENPSKKELKDLIAMLDEMVKGCDGQK